MSNFADGHLDPKIKKLRTARQRWARIAETQRKRGEFEKAEKAERMIMKLTNEIRRLRG